jgi:hypothetical protein
LVVTPFDAIYDVAYTWKQWGGAWNEADAVHFELPGASAEAKRLGEQNSNIVARGAQAFADLPWYVSLALPVSTMTTSSNESQINKKLCSWFGINC